MAVSSPSPLLSFSCLPIFKKKKKGKKKKKNCDSFPFSYVSLAIVPTRPNLSEKKKLHFFITKPTKVFVEEKTMSQFSLLSSRVFLIWIPADKSTAYTSIQGKKTFWYLAQKGSLYLLQQNLGPSCRSLVYTFLVPFVCHNCGFRNNCWVFSILPHLDYCSEIWHQCGARNTKKNW